MNKSLIFSIVLLPTVFGNIDAYLAADKALWYGTVKFPYDTKITEPVAVYYAGDQIITEIQQETHQISFAISEYKMRNEFFLLISNDIEWVTEQNTIKFQRICKSRPYKLFHLKFNPNREITTKITPETDLNALGSWEITQKALRDDMRIPDNAIIVHYHPNLIQNVEGGNALELPKIVLNEQILHQLTPDELHDVSAQFILSSLDLKTIHAKQNTQIKHDIPHKTIIALTA
ncbi:MAG: hypothetical protein WD055_00715 [Candidatus Dependentiae bacterium]